MSPSGQPHAGSAGTISGGAEFSLKTGQEAVPFLVRRTAQRVLKAMGTGAMGWPVYGGAAAGKQHLPLAQACPSSHDSRPQEPWSLLQARLYLHNRKSNVWSLPNTRAMSQRWKVGKRGFDLLAGGCLRRSLGQALVLEQCLSLLGQSLPTPTVHPPAVVLDPRRIQAGSTQLGGSQQHCSGHF